MNLLILGATGFVGSWLTTKLLNDSNHHVICGVQDVSTTQRKFPKASIVYCNFITDVNLEDWLPKLKGIDVIINCVGIFRANSEIMRKVHYLAPKAIFDAAQQVGVKRIIHLSALGIENYDSEYAKSKLEAENYLRTYITAQHFILKPSLIYGPGATGGIELMTSLASFPFYTPLPGNGEQELQPIHVEDYTNAIINLIETNLPQSISLTAASQQVIQLRSLLAELRNWLGLQATTSLKMPEAFMKIVGYLGNITCESLITTSSLAMLEQSNVSNVDKILEFQTVTTVTPVNFSEGLHRAPSTSKDKNHARFYFMFPLLRISLALMWILSALTSVFFAKESSYELLTAAQITPAWQNLTLYSSAALNAIIGILLLFNYKPKLNCIVQLLVILVYTILITILIPRYWLEPFGPVVKNIPILVSIGLLLIHSQ